MTILDMFHMERNEVSRPCLHCAYWLGHGPIEVWARRRENWFIKNGMRERYQTLQAIMKGR